jgi:NTP pyrophosphatase (non-canonical NTP hydrolase)
MERHKVYQLIDAERDYQDGLYGTPRQRDLAAVEWVSILMDEMNEVMQALTSPGGWDFQKEHGLMDELRQVAAVTVAIMEVYGAPKRYTYKVKEEAQHDRSQV